ncbi:MAG: hypothetical protein E6J63_02120 [Deltaproteobacteria bacterium]|nr:MAG: hypothetical protein E6J63_02120 [Deltaproteobacteria bacterium]
MIEPHCIKTFPGLCASSNTTTVPEGACEISDDVVIRSRNVPECRRGYKATASAGSPLNAIGFKEGQAIALTYDTSSNTGTLRAYNPATKVWTTLIAASTALPRGGVARFRTHGAGTNAARDAPPLRLSIFVSPYLLWK